MGVGQNPGSAQNLWLWFQFSHVCSFKNSLTSQISSGCTDRQKACGNGLCVYHLCPEELCTQGPGEIALVAWCVVRGKNNTHERMRVCDSCAKNALSAPLLEQPGVTCRVPFADCARNCSAASVFCSSDGSCAGPGQRCPCPATKPHHCSAQPQTDDRCYSDVERCAFTRTDSGHHACPIAR